MGKKEPFVVNLLVDGPRMAFLSWGLFSRHEACIASSQSKMDADNHRDGTVRHGTARQHNKRAPRESRRGKRQQVESARRRVFNTEAIEQVSPFYLPTWITIVNPHLPAR